jgi:hypothetical protein
MSGLMPPLSLYASMVFCMDSLSRHLLISIVVIIMYAAMTQCQKFVSSEKLAVVQPATKLSHSL